MRNLKHRLSPKEVASPADRADLVVFHDRQHKRPFVVIECKLLWNVCELTKQVSWSETRPGLFHYRTHAQQEVDFVLEDGRGRLVGIEVKKTASPASSDFKGLRHLAEQTGKRFLRGILLYTGASSVAFESNLHAVPVSSLWQLQATLAKP